MSTPFDMFKNLANIRITASVVNDVGDFITHIGNAYTNASPEDKEKIADGMHGIQGSREQAGQAGLSFYGSVFRRQQAG